MRTSTCCAAFGVVVLLSACCAAPAHAQKDPESTVAKSVQVISEITRNPKTGMPPLVMRKAEAFAIIPDMFKMSFIFGARFGRGLLIVKQPDGTWSNPVFIHLVGGSFGAQAGAQSTDLVLVFQSRNGLNRFLKGKGKLTMGVDVGAAAGPVGKRFEASTDATFKSEILSYSNTRGIFAGVSAEGGTLQIDGRSNTIYYRQPVAPGSILAINSPLPVGDTTLALQRLLSEKTATPGRIVKGGARVTEPVIIGEDIPVEESDDVVVRPQQAPRTSRKPETRRRVEPEDTDDLDLDAIPPARTSRSKPSAAPRASSANDEDLPEALPEAAPPKRRTRPAPVDPDDDDDYEVPRLDAPR